MGVELFPWQRLVLDCWCSRDARDRPSHVTCGLSVPRQNGKNAALEAYELYMLAVCAAHVLHTAHRVKTAKKSFQRLVRYFTDRRHPELCALVSNIRYTNGEEAIHLANGGSIEFSARSRAGARGFDDIQIVVFDEAQDLQDDQLNAIMYTLAASSTGDRQMIFTGTPPDASSPGTVFRRTRAAALTSPPRRSAWQEWGVEGLPPRGATFEELVPDVLATNPSMGYVLDLDFTEDEFGKSDLLGFAVERLGYWIPDASADLAVPAGLWEGAAIPEIADLYRGRTAFGVKFSPDGSTYALAGCKLRGGRSREAAVELVDLGTTEGGTASLARFLWERRSKASAVAVDGLSAASALCDNMDGLKSPRGYVMRPGTQDVISAAQAVIDGLRDGTLAHTPDPALDASATGSARRRIGNRGGWGFGDTEAAQSAAIEAAALALWAARTTRRDPRRKQRLM